MKYLVKLPLLHDGKKYKSDDQVELTDDLAQPLLKVRAIAVTEQEQPDPAPPSKGGKAVKNVNDAKANGDNADPSEPGQAA